MKHTQRVVTWQTPGGNARFDLCTACDEAGRRMPRSGKGEEFCQVYKGLHHGRCSFAGQTTAETIADLMGNDGERFETADGKPLDELCEEHGATVERWQDEDGNRSSDDPVRYVFADGSAIVIAGAGWDIEGAEPYSWGGA